MGVYIRGMEMPESCSYCEWIAGVRRSDGFVYYCKKAAKESPMFDARSGRMAICPLIEVPEPHGRLIDADDLCYRIDAGKRTISSLPFQEDFIAMYALIADGVKEELMKCDTIIPEEGDPR